MELACFQAVDSGQNVGIPIDGIDAIALAGSNERKVNGYCFGTGIRAGKQAVLPYKNPALDRAFAFVVVYGNVGIFEKSGKSNPVFESIANCLHQVMGWMKGRLGVDDGFAERFNEGFGFFSANGQSEGSGLAQDFAFDLVQLSVDIENGVTNVRFNKLGLEISAPGMSTASGFDSLSIFKQGIEASCRISLNDAAKVFEKLQVPVKRQIWRIIKDGGFLFGVTDVSGHFTFANVVFVFAVLNFNGRVVGLDDAGLEQFFFIQGMQKGERIGSGLHPVTLGGARNQNIFAGKDFLLAIIWQSVIKFADNDLCQQAWTRIAPGDWWTRFFCGDYILLALWARTSLLIMIKDLQAGTNHLELMGEEVANKIRLDVATRANRVFRLDGVLHRFVGQVLSVVQNMLRSCGFISFRSRIRFSGSSRSGARIVPFCRFSILALVAFFRLHNQHFKLLLQILEKLSQFIVTIELQLQLSLQIFDQREQAVYFCPGVGVLLPQL